MRKLLKCLLPILALMLLTACKPAPEQQPAPEAAPDYKSTITWTA